MTVTVELTTGLPASGKSTFAKQRVAKSNGELRRVNLDDLRNMLDNGTYSVEHERTALKIQDQIIVQAVREGYNVIVDNTHLHKRIPARIEAALAPYDVDWKVHSFLDVSASECIRRDEERKAKGERGVGKDVIARMARKRTAWMLTEDFFTANPRVEIFVPSQYAQPAIICDLDGTLALHHGRDPYDTAKCGSDLVNYAVLAVLLRYSKNGESVLLVSGRDEEFRPQTERWLKVHGIKFDALFMRPAGDRRRDDVVKLEIFDKYIREPYDVDLILDDRNRVVNMWRALRIPTWQVAEGDF